MDTKNQLNTAPVGQCTCDSNGNLTATTSPTSYTFGYDDENRLTSVRSGTSYRSDFIYDGLGRMRYRLDYTWTGSSWTSSGTTTYLYDGMRVIQERNSGTPAVSYTRGSDLSGSLEGAGGIGGLLARSHAYQSGSGNFTNHNYYHADGNGNITYLVNSSQTLAASYRYDPYGNTISSSGSLASANVYRFSSKEIHVNSGLYYYGYRWYAPSLQRWLNRDPIEEEGGMNLYLFALNGPINHVDPLGLTVPFVRKCRGWEQADCEAKCGAAGVKSCEVTENYEYEPGKPSKLVSTDINCTCNPPPKSTWDNVCELFWLYVEVIGLRSGGGAIQKVERKVIPIIIKPRPVPVPAPAPAP